MSKKIVFLFAGQGSQYYGMGRELYESHAGFRSWMDRGSSLAEPRLGVSLVRLLYARREDRFKPFDRVLYTHPAIFLVNFSVARALEEEGIIPSCLVGYSLGENGAWAVAGAVSFEQSLAFVIDSARLIEEQTPPGGMLAVLGSPALWDTHPALFTGTSRAGVNYEAHFVIAGREPDLLRTQSLLKERGVTCQLLDIRRGFHSPLVEPIAPSLRSLAARLEVGVPHVPVVSCLAGRSLGPADLGPDYWWDLLRQPAQFARAIRTLEQGGEPHFYIDVGPTGTLASFVKQLAAKSAGSRALPVLTPFGHDLSSLARLKAALNT